MRTVVAAVLLATGAVLALDGPVGAAAADVDPTYGVAGQSVVDGASAAATVDLALAPDGSLIGVGTVPTTSHGTDGTVFRLTPTGAQDQSFGVRHLDNAGADDVARAVAVQPDGKIVVAGWTSKSSDAAVWRLLPSGQLDQGFGVDGFFPLANAGVELGSAVAVAPDGKILVGGSTTHDAPGGGTDNVVFRLTAAGVPDWTWGNRGVWQQGDVGNEVVRSVAVRPDGRVHVASFRGTGSSRPAVLRLLPDAQPDPSFAGGSVEVALGNGVGAALAPREDGAVVVASGHRNGSDLVVLRLDTSGAPVTEFGGFDGAVVDLGGNELVSALETLPGDRVLLAGRTSTQGGRNFVTVLDRTGRPDATFGDGGVVYLTSTLEVAVVAQPDGRVLFGGPVSEDSDDVLVGRLLARRPPVAPDGGTLAPTCHGRPATLVGTEGRDRLSGTRGPDVVVGLGGDDVVRGLGGDDLVCAGPGRDRVSGGAGRDRLHGEQGADRLSGGAGRDRLVGGPGKDRSRP